MAKKYKGVAKIELTNVNTGETTVQTEENLVTNAVANILTKNPWGAINYHRYANIVNLMSGIMLFDKTINENVNNTMIPFSPAAWAGDTTNSGASTVRGSINNPACVVTDTGAQLVWEWNTSQANGTYKCIALTNPKICNTDIWANTDLKNVIGQHMAAGYVDRTNPNTEYRDNCIGSMVFYDDKKGYYYKVIVAMDGKSVEIRRAYRPCDKQPIGQVNLWNSNNFALNNALAGQMAKDIRSVTKSLDISATYEQTNYSNVISASWYNNEIYLFSLRRNTDNVLLTKINLGDDFTEANITVTQQTLVFNGIKYHVYPLNNNQIGTQMKDCVCFNYPYLYLPKINDNRQYYKLNINDTEDISELDWSGNTVAANTIMPGVTLGNYYVNSKGFRINLTEDKVVTQNGQFTSGANAYSILTLCNDAFVLCQDPGSGLYDKAEEYLYANPFYLATINNITPFTKTSEHTLKITYTITDVNS